VDAMESNIITDPIKRYFNTLEFKGSIDTKETKILMLLLFLNEYIDYTLRKKQPDINIYHFYNCLYKQSCTITKRLKDMCYHVENDKFTYIFDFSLS
jgi:hypothetical protein